MTLVRVSGYKTHRKGYDVVVRPYTRNVKTKGRKKGKKAKHSEKKLKNVIYVYQDKHGNIFSKKKPFPLSKRKKKSKKRR